MMVYIFYFFLFDRIGTVNIGWNKCPIWMDERFGLTTGEYHIPQNKIAEHKNYINSNLILLAFCSKNTKTRLH